MNRQKEAERSFCPIMSSFASAKLIKIYSTAISLAIVFAIFIYGFNFNALSETEMMNMSFIWLPLTIFGVSGLLTLKKKRPLLLAISWGILSAVMLFMFFVVIWPML